MKQVECVVVGGGPAGLAAALAAARAGVQVLLVDENPELGGQYYRQPPSELGVDGGHELGKEYDEGRALIDDVRRANVELRLKSVVWGIIDERTVGIATGETGEWVRAGMLVLASGAYDRPVAFPGWTLPGVVSAGGAQNLMKAYQVLPGRRVLVAGSGPLLLVVAKNLARGGAEVVAVCEAASRARMLRHAPALLRHPTFVYQGAQYWRRLRRAHVPILAGHILTRIMGDQTVEGVSIAACDETWASVRGSERTFEVDSVVLGYGFIPSVELCRSAGCAIRFAPELESWLPVRSEELEGTVPGVFVVGDGAGVAGSAVALVEGQLAGLAVARRLRRLDEAAYASQRASIARRYRHLLKFRAAMDSLYRVRPGLWTLTDEDTPLCRCEEVSVREVRDAIHDGATDLNEVKAWTRVGMGRCQGRMCEPNVAGLLARETGVSPGDVGRFTPRMPVKPIPVTAIISAEAAERQGVAASEWVTTPAVTDGL